MNASVINALINAEIRRGEYKVRSARKCRRKLDIKGKEWESKGFYVYFATFTFADVDSFNRKKFADYLRRTCNIKAYLFADYGEANNRFHLHGYIACNYELNCKEKDYFNKFGFTKFTKVKTNESYSKYIVKYSVKMSDFKMFRALIIR